MCDGVGLVSIHPNSIFYSLLDHSMGGQVSTADVHVVVVGGGFGGIAAALRLQSRGLAFTLIDLRDSFHHNVAALRASLQPGNIMTLEIPN